MENDGPAPFSYCISSDLLATPASFHFSPTDISWRFQDYLPTSIFGHNLSLI